VIPPAPSTSDTARHIAAVVLAAGASTRLGQPKQLLIYQGEPLIRRATHAAIAAGASPVVVVLGANADAVARALHGIDAVISVTNDNWHDGLASSLAAGVTAVMTRAPETDGILIAVSDQPLVDAVALRQLMENFSGDQRLVAAEYSGTIGVPAIVGREHFDALCALEGDTGAGRWLRTRSAHVTRVPMPDAAIDVDTAHDAERHLR